MCIRDRDYRIRVREASPNGLIYVLGYDLGNVREGAGRILSVSLIITGILVVLFLISRIFTAILYLSLIHIFGNKHQPLIRDPQPTAQADYVIMESTYGDRLHSTERDVYKRQLHPILLRNWLILWSMRRRNGIIRPW